ncbi:Major Facilitator Superfamily protein [Marinomonas gallaica]|uniref:Major Facilitator Superfamily protein n=1 Tax=Marinomonas gallaica TaxID=1806667 RepID=A0A1C3JNW3_9GAMM|nr:MFS transporter [Marinomonas gallaica]SBT16864.1 Major Facilitator Superfamily protein [Marinomonas gallaica]SBT20580.1 Major Facilitator Superfamily protein [Marinomonas gallaica]
MSGQSWVMKLYKGMVKTSEKDSEEKRSVAKNFLKLISAQFLTNTGDAIVNPKVTLPWLMQSVGAPTFLVAWLVPIRESGSLLPQLFIASAMRRLAIRKWVWVSGSAVQALSLLLMALVADSLDGLAAGVCILLLLTLFSLARGLNSVATKDILGKTIPKSERGQVTGLSASAAGLVTIGIAVMMAVSYLYDWHTSAYFVWGLVLGAVLWLLSALIFSKVEETKSDTEESDFSFFDSLKQLALLKTDKSFRHFVITRACFLGTALSAPYYVVLAEDRIGNSVWVLAMFMGLSGLAGLLSGPFWGRFSDVSSRKVLITASTLGAMTGVFLFVIAQLAPSALSSVWLLPLFYFLLTVFHQGIRVGRKTYLVDMAEGNKRTSYVAVGNTAIGVMLLIFSLIGILGDVFSLELLVLVYALITLIGVVMAIRLPDVSKS